MSMSKAAYQKEWMRRHPSYMKDWRAANPDRAKQHSDDYYARLKDQLFTELGGAQCVCCGETNRGFLTIDHPNNDGAVERRSGSRRALLRIRDGEVQGQVLCYNCNLGRAQHGGICPHQES